MSILVFWLDFGIYRKVHNVFETLNLVSLLAKFIPGGLELGKELTTVCCKRI